MCLSGRPAPAWPHLASPRLLLPAAAATACCCLLVLVQVVVRDPAGLSEDLRAQLLAYKRDDLRRVLAGQPLPPSFGALVFT